MNGSIIKLEYKRSFFDVSEMKPGARTIITISEDGSIVSKDYEPGSRKAKSVKRKICPLAAFEELCHDILDCIADADRQDFYVDDSTEELKIYHQYGRIQTMDRGLGKENIHIADIMHRFLDTYL